MAGVTYSVHVQHCFEFSLVKLYFSSVIIDYLFITGSLENKSCV